MRYYYTSLRCLQDARWSNAHILIPIIFTKGLRITLGSITQFARLSSAVSTSNGSEVLSEPTNCRSQPLPSSGQSLGYESTVPFRKIWVLDKSRKSETVQNPSSRHAAQSTESSVIPSTLIRKYYAAFAPLVRRYPLQLELRRIPSPLEIRKVCSRLRIKITYLWRLKKHFTRLLVARIRKHFSLQSIRIRTDPLTPFPDHQVRILTRSRAGPGNRSKRKWKVLSFDKIAKYGNRKPLTSNSRDTKWISLQPFRSPSSRYIKTALDEIDTSWLSRYAVISEQGRTLVLPRRAEKSVWPRMITLDMSTQQVLEVWQNIKPMFVKSRWRDYMLWAMQRKPEIALKSLDVAITQSIPRISRQILEDCLDFLAAVFLKRNSTPDPSKLEDIYQLTCSFIKAASSQRSAGSNSINQRTVHLLITHCSNDQAENLYQTICDHKFRLYSFTLLHFLRKFGDMGNKLLCVDVIQKITESRIDTGSDIVQSAFVRLLKSRNDQSWYKSSSYFLTECLRMGIRPRIFMFNNLILNSVEAGDYKTAFHLYKVAQERELKPDAITYRVLLKGCWKSMDQENLESIVRDIETNETLNVDDELIFYILYTFFKIEINIDRLYVFSNMLSVYTRFYAIQPLREVVSVDIDSPIQASNPPSTRALGIMLIAYIRQYSDSHHTLLNLYQRYWDGVNQGHPLIAPLAATEHVANAFILAFGRDRHTINVCTSIIRSMLQLEQASPSTLGFSRSSRIAGPTVSTWSIYLMSFGRHGQMATAEKILSMMKSRGIEPNNVTWNNLIHGYAITQDIINVMGSIKRMEVEGHSIDDYTVAGLGRLRDRDSLIEMMNSTMRKDMQAAEYSDGLNCNDEIGENNNDI